MAERNMDMKKCPMPVQDPDVRNKNFDEVALGYTYEMAVNEARRCLNCPKKPCQSACPVQIDIPAFIERVANEDMDGAFEILSKSTSLPAVCGRVCPQENQCEGKCVRGIKGEAVGIGRLERFVADYHREHCTDTPEMPEQLGEPDVVPIETALERAREAAAGKPIVFLGDGVPVFEKVIRETLGENSRFMIPARRYQSAASIALLGQYLYQKGEVVSAEKFGPVYLRKSQAEREREEKNT